jgi:putrescine transport system ATP-binding protein
MALSPSERLAVRLDGTAPPAGSVLRVAVRPERVALASDGGSVADNRLDGTVSAVDYVGPITTYRVKTAVGTILVPQQNDARRSDRDVGGAVTLEWPADAVLVLDPPNRR